MNDACHLNGLRISFLIFSLLLPAVVSAEEPQSNGNTPDSLVILGVGTFDDWVSDLEFSSPSTSVEGEMWISQKPIVDPVQAGQVPFVGAVLTPLGSTWASPNVDVAAQSRLTTLYATPGGDFSLPVARARLHTLSFPTMSIDVPVFRLSTLLELNPSVLSFPGGVRYGAAHSNLALANLRRVRQILESDPGDGVTLLIEIYSSDGARLASRALTLAYGETAYIVDIVGALGITTLDSRLPNGVPGPHGIVRVSRTGGSGFFWGVLSTREIDGSLTVSLGLAP